MRAKKRPIQGQTSCPVRGAGFTLVEVMLVMVISGLLAAIALPAYQTQLIKGRRVDAVNALSDVLHAQERWRSNRNSRHHSGCADSGNLGRHRRRRTGGCDRCSTLTPAREMASHVTACAEAAAGWCCSSCWCASYL